jgi:SAM-dependent methyltransferase
VYTIDISDQAIRKQPGIANYTPIIYDGYRVDLAPRSIDVIFSDHFIEHLLWEDIELHFATVHRILRPGGVYLFRVPHAYLGPHDISKYFARTAQGFHLHECSYSEIEGVVRKQGFRTWIGHRRVRKKYRPVPFTYLRIVEMVLKPFPRPIQKFFSRPLLPRFLFMAAVA